MRLLKAGPYAPGDEILEIIEKRGKAIPPYAILSHTWSSNADDEVLFSDVVNGTCYKKPAYSKLKKAMQRARLDGYDWLWIDTCCIDKTSSAELSENINSMYSYYAKSQKCYAYLADVTDTNIAIEPRSPFPFQHTRWWERGWTLQELLAPLQLEFFNADWVSLGYKHNLAEAVSQISGIPRQHLTGKWPVEHASIARRMSWAARRTTTREEDIAYSLIGIFGVNMPMLYGEGGIKAFVRLQEEILRCNEDQSLFAWFKSDQNNDVCHHGLLADSPKDFASAGNIIPYIETGEHAPATMTPRGLNITFPVSPTAEQTVIAALQCPVPARHQRDWLAVHLRRLPTGRNQYTRVRTGTLAWVSKPGEPTDLYVRQHFPSFPIEARIPFYCFQLRTLEFTGGPAKLRAHRVVDYRSAVATEETKRIAATCTSSSFASVPVVYEFDWKSDSINAALLIKRSHDGATFAILLGTCSDSSVGAIACDVERLATLDEMQMNFSVVPAGTCVSLERYRVRFNFEELVRKDQTVYFVDIDVECLDPPETIQGTPRNRSWINRVNSLLQNT